MRIRVSEKKFHAHLISNEVTTNVTSLDPKDLHFPKLPKGQEFLIHLH